jgi:hypothetical protein
MAGGPIGGGGPNRVIEFVPNRGLIPDAVAAGITVALTGVSSTTGRGTVGVLNTHALIGISTTTAVGSVKAALSKALAGVATTASVGTLGVTRSKAIAGISTATTAGAVLSSRSAPISGVQATASVGIVTATTGIVAALTGISSSATIGTIGAIAQSSSITEFASNFSLRGWRKWHRPEDEKRLRLRITPAVAEVITEVAERQAAQLDLDEQQRLEELSRKLELKGLQWQGRYLELLNTQRQQLIDEEIGRLMQQKQAEMQQRDEEAILLLLMIS